MNFSKKLLVMPLALLAFPCFAGTREAGNGGSPVALQFINAADQVIHEVTETISLYPLLQGIDLKKIRQDAQVYSVTTPLFVPVAQGKQQEVIASNFPSTDTILVNEAIWDSTPDLQLRKAIALHELLGLVGIEGTGNYKVSEVYYDRVGVLSPDCQEGCGADSIPALENSPDFSIETAQNLLSHGTVKEAISYPWILDRIASYRGQPEVVMLSMLKSRTVANKVINFLMNFSTNRLTVDFLLNETLPAVTDQTGVQFSAPIYGGVGIAYQSQENFVCRVSTDWEKALICQVSFAYNDLDREPSLQAWDGKILMYLKFIAAQ